MKKTVGFTVVEIVVVVSVIAILSSVVFANLNQASAQSRDAKRQADLRNLQTAIELYRQKEGRYPAGCRGANEWSGQSGTDYACSSGNEYIIGLTYEYISVLPTDPKLNGTNSGYVYRTNTDGTAYKIMAVRTVERETILHTHTHVFKSCSVTNSNTGVCDTVYFASNNVAPSCNDSSEVFTKSYGLWGGYPLEPLGGVRSEEQLENVICRMP